MVTNHSKEVETRASNAPPPDNSVNLRGWITPLVELVLRLVVRPADLFHGSREESQEKFDSYFTARRARKVDTYVACCLAIEVVVFLVVGSRRWQSPWVLFPPVVMVMYRALMIPANAILIPLFHGRNLPSGKPRSVASYERMIVLGFVNYIELILCFACLYASFPSMIEAERLLDSVDFIYLSTITQLTVGYGEIHPIGWMRVAACVQGLSAFLVIFLLFGRFVALLRPEISMEELVRKDGGG